LLRSRIFSPFSSGVRFTKQALDSVEKFDTFFLDSPLSFRTFDICIAVEVTLGHPEEKM